MLLAMAGAVALAGEARSLTAVTAPLVGLLLLLSLRAPRFFGASIGAAVLLPWVLGLGAGRYRLEHTSGLHLLAGLGEALDLAATGALASAILAAAAAFVLMALGRIHRHLGAVLTGFALAPLTLGLMLLLDRATSGAVDLSLLERSHAELLESSSTRIDGAFLTKVFAGPSVWFFVPLLIAAGWALGHRGKRSAGMAPIALVLTGLFLSSSAQREASDKLEEALLPPWGHVEGFMPLTIGEQASALPSHYIDRGTTIRWCEAAQLDPAVAVDARLGSAELRRLFEAAQLRGLHTLELIGRRYHAVTPPDPITPALLDPTFHLGGIRIPHQQEGDAYLLHATVTADPSLTLHGPDGPIHVPLGRAPYRSEHGSGVVQLELGASATAHDLALAVHRLEARGYEPVVVLEMPPSPLLPWLIRR